MRKSYLQYLLIGLVTIFSVPESQATKYAGEFLSIGVGARALGMGGAFVGVANDASASYWNPAGLVQMQQRELSIMHAERFAGIVKYDWISYIHPHQSGSRSATFGISLIRLGVDEIPITVLDDESRPKVDHWASDAEYALFVSYAGNMRPSIAYGGNVKVLRKGVDDYSAWGLGVDISMLYRPTDRVRLGVNLQDATTTLVAWDNGTRESISPTCKIGGAYVWACQLLQGIVTPAVDIDFRFEDRNYASQFHWGKLSADFRFGAEYWFKKLFALRLGSDDLGRFSAGTGFRLDQLGLNLENLGVDFAFLSKGDLDNTYRVSASVGF